LAVDETRLPGESPLSAEEKQAIMDEYAPKAHLIGTITNIIHTVVFFLPPLFVAFLVGIPTDWGAVWKGTVAVWGFAMPFWFIEPISYFVILGIAGTYISFLAGNISNFRLPVSAVAQEVAEVREGSHEGEIIGTLAVVATQIMIVISALSGALFVTLVVKLLPEGFKAAFDWLLPSIWGAIFIQFALRSWKYGLVALILAIIVVVYSGLPMWSHVPILVFVMALLAIYMYSKNLWLMED